MASEREQDAKAERDARLAEALRANLRRRKAQAREAAEDHDSIAPPDDAGAD